MQSGSEDPRIAYFDELAPRWDTQGPSAKEMIQTLQNHADLIDLRNGQDLLEVGCGTGKTTGYLVGQVAPGRVTAIDFSPEMIRLAKAKGFDADLRVLDVCSQALPEASYDVAMCYHVFPHFRDRRGALENLARSLRPGGRLIVLHTRGSSRINAFHAELEGPVRGDALPVGAAAWRELLCRAGLGFLDLQDEEDLFFVEASRGKT
jgi:ubiquinone/menaquinone biosynthesis C-methylase UbiE